MSEKKKKNVQLVEEKTPEKEPETVSLPFDISDKMRAKAKVMGFPLEELLQWAGSVELRFKILVEKLGQAPQEVVRLLKAEAMKTQKQRIQGGEGQPESGEKIGLSQVLGLLTAGGGATQDPVMQMYQKEILQAGLESARMGTAFQKALVIKLVPTFADEILKGIGAPPKGAKSE